jgi:hypothetical protein
MKGHMKAEEKIKATNPYSGQSEMLTKDEYIVYDLVKKFEEMEEYEVMQEGLDLSLVR